MKCAVNGCKSGPYNLLLRQVSLHKLPDDPVMREAWLRTLGKSYLPPQARVCSAHFSKESFVQAQRKRIKHSVSTRKSGKLLLPHAVPTLMLTMVTSARNTPAVTADITTLTCSDVNSSLGTAQSDIDNPCGNVSPATEALATACNMNVSSVNVETSKCNSLPSKNDETKGLSKITSRRTSDPLWIGGERYFNANGERGLEQDLHSEVSYFHVQQAVCSATSTLASVQAENDDLKLQLQHANAEIERMREEIKMLNKVLEDRQAKIGRPNCKKS